VFMSSSSVSGIATSMACMEVSCDEKVRWVEEQIVPMGRAFCENVRQHPYKSGYDQKVFSVWKNCLAIIQRRMNDSFFPSDMREYAIGLSRLWFCAIPEIERSEIEHRATRLRESIVRCDTGKAIHSNEYWEEILKRKIKHSTAFFSRYEEVNSAVKWICGTHVHWLSNLHHCENGGSSSYVLERVQQANLKVAAQVEAMLGRSKYPWHEEILCSGWEIAHRFQTSFLSQIDSLSQRFEQLNSRSVSSLEHVESWVKEYEECCAGIERVSREKREIVLRTVSMFVSALGRLHVQHIWGGKTQEYMRRIGEIFNKVFKRGECTTEKVSLEGEGVCNLTCHTEKHGAEVSIKYRVCEYNKSVFFLLFAHLNEQQKIEYAAYIKFSDLCTEYIRKQEFYCWQLFLDNNVPNIPPMLPVFSKGEKGIKGFLSPWCGYGCMWNMVSRKEALASWPEHKRMTVLIQVAEALAGIHALGYVHLDVKSKNVLLMRYDEAFLTDFGTTTSMGTWQMAGTTRPYMAPEQFFSLRADPAMDMWSFGLLIIETLYGIDTNKFLKFDGVEDSKFTDLAFSDEMEGEWKETRVEQLRELSIAAPTTPLIRSLLSIEPKRRPKAFQAAQRLRLILATGHD